MFPVSHVGKKKTLPVKGNAGNQKDRRSYVEGCRKVFPPRCTSIATRNCSNVNAPKATKMCLFVLEYMTIATTPLSPARYSSRMAMFSPFVPGVMGHGRRWLTSVGICWKREAIDDRNVVCFEQCETGSDGNRQIRSTTTLRRPGRELDGNKDAGEHSPDRDSGFSSTFSEGYWGTDIENEEAFLVTKPNLSIIVTPKLSCTSIPSRDAESFPALVDIKEKIQKTVPLSISSIPHILGGEPNDENNIFNQDVHAINILEMETSDTLSTGGRVTETKADSGMIWKIPAYYGEGLRCKDRLTTRRNRDGRIGLLLRRICPHYFLQPSDNFVDRPQCGGAMQIVRLVVKNVGLQVADAIYYMMTERLLERLKGQGHWQRQFPDNSSEGPSYCSANKDLPTISGHREKNKRNRFWIQSENSLKQTRPRMKWAAQYSKYWPFELLVGLTEGDMRNFKNEWTDTDMSRIRYTQKSSSSFPSRIAHVNTFSLASSPSKLFPRQVRFRSWTNRGDYEKKFLMAFGQRRWGAQIQAQTGMFTARNQPNQQSTLVFDAPAPHHSHVGCCYLNQQIALEKRGFSGAVN
ncbi:hypothetical protein BDP27DRAFT_1370986 [Rhodocollybia butyracea]|uniref:Uncharacterized protein n=1 Tax=Rhodocollybia butyracea TaxID=206335 RepID=A0A9P5PAJ6_9AGAR|nr:hypothetical protein BDP27DRAFT_1370986 [Rhodocollybia butyracea]